MKAKLAWSDYIYTRVKNSLQSNELSKLSLENQDRGMVILGTGCNVGAITKAKLAQSSLIYTRVKNSLPSVGAPNFC